MTDKTKKSDNPLSIRANKLWPNMYEFFFKKGGTIPADLTGQYTSHDEAEKALVKYLG